VRKGSQTITNYRISGFHRKKERELNARLRFVKDACARAICGCVKVNLIPCARAICGRVKLKLIPCARAICGRVKVKLIPYACMHKGVSKGPVD
jgi:hypothetical protein